MSDTPIPTISESVLSKERKGISTLMTAMVDACGCKAGDTTCDVKKQKLNMTVNAAATGVPINEAVKMANVHIDEGAKVSKSLQLDTAPRIAVARATVRDMLRDAGIKDTDASEWLIQKVEQEGRSAPSTDTVASIVQRAVHSLPDRFSSVRSLLSSSAASGPVSSYLAFTPRVWAQPITTRPLSHDLSFTAAASYDTMTTTSASSLPVFDAPQSVHYMYQFGWASLP